MTWYKRLGSSIVVWLFMSWKTIIVGWRKELEDHCDAETCEMGENSYEIKLWCLIYSLIFFLLSLEKKVWWHQMHPGYQRHPNSEFWTQWYGMRIFLGENSFLDIPTDIVLIHPLNKVYIFDYNRNLLTGGYIPLWIYLMKHWQYFLSRHKVGLCFPFPRLQPSIVLRCIMAASCSS